jgi:hypothetical protein
LNAAFAMAILDLISQVQSKIYTNNKWTKQVRRSVKVTFTFLASHQAKVKILQTLRWSDETILLALQACCTLVRPSVIAQQHFLKLKALTAIPRTRSYGIQQDM